MQEQMGYLLSRVGELPPAQNQIIERHIRFCPKQGTQVFGRSIHDPRQDEAGLNIIEAELITFTAASQSGALNTFWDLRGQPSEGLRVDTDVASGLGLALNLIEVSNQVRPPSTPQIAHEIIQEILSDPAQKPTMNRVHILMDAIRIARSVVINWDDDMTGETQDWQRIRLGLALACSANYPNFQIRLCHVGREGFENGTD
ncbi:MAG: hypothetical protein WC841_05905 [Candidatus Shapirobacteria bacterium]|jgi:hypothetical protein